MSLPSLSSVSLVLFRTALVSLGFVASSNVFAQTAACPEDPFDPNCLDPLQVFEQFTTPNTCPADDPDAPNNWACSSNDIKLDLVTLTDLTECQEGETVSATFEIDLEVNANIRYNPMVWISYNGLDPRITGSACFVSSVPDGPATHLSELLFADANECADIDVPNNNFTLEGLKLGTNSEPSNFSARTLLTHRTAWPTSLSS
jgi:hypothetical protein